MEHLTLSGFSRIDPGARLVAEKMSTNHTARIKKKHPSLDSIKLTLKTIHEREKSEKYVLNGKILNNGKIVAVETEHRNLFMALEALFAKLEKQLDQI